MERIDKAMLDILRCPVSGQALHMQGDGLATADGSRNYAIVDGIPILSPEAVKPTHQGYQTLIAENKKTAMRRDGYSEEEAAGFLDGMLVPTCGNLFRGVRLSGDYPIPDFPRFSPDAIVLDIGCNWGRWSIAGAKNGYRVVGVDIHLESLLCARWLSRKLVPDNPPFFILADARHLPLAPAVFEGAFSYSVIQHFSRTNAAAILREIHRVMKPGAKSIIQMPNKAGLATLLTKQGSRNSEGTEFDVRYYSIAELLAMFEREIGKSDWYVDCFFGLNIHKRDKRLVPLAKRWIVNAADLFLRASQAVPALGRFADSVFVSSTKA